MKKKPFFLVLSLAILVLGFGVLAFSPVFALDPVIIDQSIKGPPVGTGKDQDYHSNDILNTDTVKCPGSVDISQSFNPIVSGSGPNSTFKPYDVNQIGATIDSSGPWTNTDFEDATGHLSSFYLHPLDPNSVQQADLSLRVNNSYGTSGTANRATPSAVSQCLKSQRLLYAVKSLDPTANLTYHNEQTGWICNGFYYSLAEKSDGSGCTSIRLSDIAADIGENIFYPLSVDCQSSLPDPVLLQSIIGNINFHPHLLSSDPSQNHTLALQLFGTVSIPDSGSLASQFEVCDSLGCKKSERQTVRGNIAPSSISVVNQLISRSQTVENYNVCQSATRTDSLSQTNPLSFAAIINKLFGTITNASQTFTAPVKTNTYVDTRLQAGLNQDKTFLNNLIPFADQQQSQTADLKGSSTDGKTLDPGNPVARTVFSQELLPANF
jgi:hypothetical protein